jgi:hypothetical protein
MMTVISIIFCIFGLYAFVRSISATSIILSVMDNRWGRPAVDKNLFEKIRVVDSVRITKWMFTTVLGASLILLSLAFLSPVNISLYWLPFVLLTIFFAKEMYKCIMFKKHQIQTTFKDIKEQWKNEDVVSERHDEEVVFKRGVCDINNVWLDIVCIIFIFILMVI